MNATQREQLRLSLLRHLDANPTRFGLGVPLLLQMCRSEGQPRLEAEDVNAELLYLEDKKLVAQAAKTISPNLATYRITAEGRDLIAPPA